MDYILVKSRRDGYELLNPYRKYLGFAQTLAQAQRFAAAAGVPMVIEPPQQAGGRLAHAGAPLRSIRKRLTA